MQRIVSIACLLLLFSSYLHATPTQNKPITLSDLETIYIQEWKQDPITNQLHEHFNTVALTQNTNNASASYQMPETITQTTVVHAALITLQSRSIISASMQWRIIFSCGIHGHQGLYETVCRYEQFDDV